MEREWFEKQHTTQRSMGVCASGYRAVLFFSFYSPNNTRAIDIFKGGIKDRNDLAGNNRGDFNLMIQ